MAPERARLVHLFGFPGAYPQHAGATRRSVRTGVPADRRGLGVRAYQVATREGTPPPC